MAVHSETIGRLAAEFAKMPGIGLRTAQRLAYYVQSLAAGEADALVSAVQAVKANCRNCSVCCTISESDPCPICTDPARDHSTVCVVERVRDLAAIEAASSYRGLYHVLGGSIAPLEGVYPEHLSIGRLLDRVKGGAVKEIILATNPDTEGDTTANYIADKLAPLGVAVSRIARGVPAGGQIEHAAKTTLIGAIQARQKVKG